MELEAAVEDRDVWLAAVKEAAAESATDAQHKLEAVIAEKEAEVEAQHRLEAVIAEKEAEVAAVKQASNEADVEAQHKLEAAIAEKEAEVEAQHKLEAVIAEKEAEVAAVIAEKEAEVAAVKQASNEADVEAQHKLEAAIANSEGELTTIKDWMNDRLQAVTGTVTEKEAELIELKRTLQSEQESAAALQEQLQAQITGLSQNYKALGVQLTQNNENSKKQKSELDVELERVEAELARVTADKLKSDEEHVEVVAGAHAKCVELKAIIRDNEAEAASLQQVCACCNYGSTCAVGFGSGLSAPFFVYSYLAVCSFILQSVHINV